MNLSLFKEVIYLIGALAGLIGGGIALHDKYYVEPNQSISKINNNIVTITNRIKEINKELSEVKEVILDLEKNKISITELDKMNLNLRNKVDYSLFNQYQHLKKDNVDWIINAINSLNDNTNLSKEIKYWQNQYTNRTNNCDYYENKNSEICREIRNNILRLQLQLKN